MDIEDLISPNAINDTLKHWDYRVLIERLRDYDTPLSRKERSFIADIFEGNIKPPNKRPKDRERDENILKAYRIFRQRIYLKDKRDFAYDYVATELGISRRTVRSYIKEIEASGIGWAFEKYCIDLFYGGFGR